MNELLHFFIVFGKLKDTGKWEFLHWDATKEETTRWLNLDIDRPHLVETKSMECVFYDDGSYKINELRSSKEKI